MFLRSSFLSRVSNCFLFKFKNLEDSAVGIVLKFPGKSRVYFWNKLHLSLKDFTIQSSVLTHYMGMPTTLPTHNTNAHFHGCYLKY